LLQPTKCFLMRKASMYLERLPELVEGSKAESLNILSLAVLLGAMTLGISSYANAGVNWIYASKQLDCQRTCGSNRVIPYPMFAGVERIKASKKLKPISICATKDKKSGLWLVGYNRWEQKSCTVAIDDKVVHSERYYCLCHNLRGMQPLW
jgi:hypothetical protein